MEHMDTLVVTVVGTDILDLALELVEKAGIPVNLVNPAKVGKLGNFVTLTYIFEIPEETIIEKRRAFMDAASDDTRDLIAMYEHGDWMNVYIFRKGSWKSRC